jgi:hypothetical protein
MSPYNGGPDHPTPTYAYWSPIDRTIPTEIAPQAAAALKKVKGE